jgi:hypothetical protein
MKKILLNLLFAVMMIPWITQAQTPCDDGANMCSITIKMYDDAWDGWNNGYLRILQNGNIIDSVTMDSDDEYMTVSVNICPDSLSIEWVQ